MKRALYILSFAMGTVLLSVSAEAACGGGGFRATKVVETERTVVRHEDSQAERNYKKLSGERRDIEKAQAKLDRCEGDCDKERRKLEEAWAKYNKKASEL